MYYVGVVSTHHPKGVQVPPTSRGPEITEKFSDVF